jgi:DNA primase
MTCHTIWGIKVRRSAGQQRYQQVSEGNIKGSLYLADEIQPGLPILLTEGEFDALIARQMGEGLISAAALGSAANKYIDPRWFSKLISAPSILICMDDDEAGQRAREQLRKLSLAARCSQVPQGKDIIEFYKRAGEK